MEDEFDAFKPTYAPKSFYNWNVGGFERLSKTAESGNCQN